MIVGSMTEAEAVIGRALGLARSRLVLGLAQDNLDAIREAQKDWWNRRFDKGLTHHPLTVAARSRALRAPRVRRRSALRGDYYRRNRPRGASASHPFAYWTGALQRSTTVFSTKTATKAEIDPSKTYAGPIRGLSNPVETIVVRRGAHPWNEAAIMPVMATYAARRMTEWLEGTGS